MVKRKKVQKETFEKYKSIEYLADEEKKLFTVAFDKMRNAYAPYSNFHVGAALLLEDGTVVGGSNQENASYGLSMCAERVALFSAGANYPNIPVKKLVVVTKNYDKAESNKGHDNCILAPCGACRQVILEYENRFGSDIEIYLMDSNKKIYKFDSVKQMLPFAFGGYFLK
ncbi:MAG TPA: cytidine deaminase [Bacteroidetes bacterium]|nr:cytidine deaminase [Bacteroidota bacterium]